MKPLALAAAAIIMVARLSSAEEQTPVFKVKTQEVRLDVLVTDHGKLVAGLQAADFEVLDSNVRQQVEFVKFEQVPISATLVFDVSRSVKGEKMDHLKIAGGVFLKELRKDERASLIAFGHAIKLGSPFTTDLEQIKAALNGIQPFGNTSVIDASYASLTIAESKTERPLIIIFSDGIDTTSWLTDEDVLEAAKQSNAVVYVVSAGQLPKDSFLHELSKFTGGSLFEVGSTKNLGEVFLRILEEFRQRYLITYIPQGVPGGGWHSIKVRIKQPHDKITYRPGYMQESAAAQGGQK
jgi:VWFA-related protein